MDVNWNVATAMAIMTQESGIMGCSKEGTGIFYYSMNN